MELISDIRNELPELKRQYVECSTHGNTEATMIGNCVKCKREREYETDRLDKIARLRARQQETGIGRLYENANLNDAIPEQQHIATVFNKYSGKENIVLFGKTGRGKTHMVCALLNSWLMRGKSCYFVKFYNLSNISVKDEYKFNKMLKCELLAIDEFGISHTDYKGTILHQIYDYRIENGLPTILITNLLPEQARESMPAPMYSRVSFNCVQLNLSGEDLRIKK